MAESTAGGAAASEGRVVRMATATEVLTWVAVPATALVAGIFYAFSGFVLPALARMPAERGIAAMQSINVTAVRAPLMLAMFGTALVCLVLAVAAIRSWGAPHAGPLLAGAVLYLLGVIVLTIVFHVPLNDGLAGLDPAAPASAAAWHDYVRRWGPGNQVRWITPLAASALLLWSLSRNT